VSQKTLVLQVPHAMQRALRERLAGGEFEFRKVPHAAFSVKGDGVVATLYESGKLVVQGSDPELFVARWTELEGSLAPEGDAQKSSLARLHLDEPLVGSDETGKGDYFGPLVVAAVRMEPAQAKELGEWNVAESKVISDERALRLAALLRTRVAHAIERLDPPEYNRVYPRYKGLNPMLAELHAKAIGKLAKKGDRVLVDQFAHERVMKAAVGGLDVRLEQAHRAEANPIVAAASVLARAEFLLGLRELSEKAGIELHKGAGAPVDAIGVRIAREHGIDALGDYAKMHFKNTQKISARLL
jgi:ribonuclease HIII